MSVHSWEAARSEPISVHSWELLGANRYRYIPGSCSERTDIGTFPGAVRERTDIGTFPAGTVTLSLVCHAFERALEARAHSRLQIYVLKNMYPADLSDKIERG
jgi:hypothetical protein